MQYNFIVFYNILLFSCQGQQNLGGYMMNLFIELLIRFCYTRRVAKITT